jgi:hypothetical protein
MPDEAEELMACQRYWLKTGAAGSSGFRYASTAAAFWDAGAISFPVTMRATPVATVVTAPTYGGCNTVFPYASSSQYGGIQVTTTAIGAYRAFNGVYAFNARL